VYDTWYWSKDEVDDRLYIDTAASAAGAGMGMFLADSGWDAATGEYDRWLNGATGDYTPPAEKFASLSDTFNFIRSALKLKIQLAAAVRRRKNIDSLSTDGALAYPYRETVQQRSALSLHAARYPGHDGGREPVPTLGRNSQLLEGSVRGNGTGIPAGRLLAGFHGRDPFAMHRPAQA
jgi:hypothetical protein